MTRKVANRNLHDLFQGRELERWRMKRKKHKSDPRYIPAGGVWADASKQVPNNSYDPQPLYYEDVSFKCRDCGKDSIWTASEQKAYHEERKGSLYAKASRCQECRRKHGEHRQRSIKGMSAKNRTVNKEAKPDSSA